MDETKEDIVVDATSTSEAAEVETTVETEQDPLKTELEKIKSKGEGRTELEKLRYKKQQLEKREKELLGDDSEPISEEDDDSAPVTVGMLKKIQAQTAAKTALQMTDEIPNEVERELVKYHLQNTIRSTGNPSEDVNLARAIVNAAKNKQVLEMVTSKPTAKSASSASSANAKVEEKPTLTTEEMEFKRAFGLSDEQILKSRPKE